MKYLFHRPMVDFAAERPVTFWIIISWCQSSLQSRQSHGTAHDWDVFYLLKRAPPWPRTSELNIDRNHNWNYTIDCNGLGEQKSYNSRSIYANLLVRNKVGLKKFVVQALTVLIWKSSFLSFLFVPFRPPSVSASVLASENASVVSPISVVCNPSILCTTVDRITTLTNWPVKLFFTRNSPFLARHIQRWNLLS